MRTKFSLIAVLALSLATIAAPAFANGPRGDHGYHRGGPAQHDRGRGHDRRDWNRGPAHKAPPRHVYAPAPRAAHRPVVVHHAPPPRVVYHSRPGWTRGHYVRTYNRPVYVVNDYYGYGLRRPPHGYHWVRDDFGDYLLVAVATGLIVDLVLHH